MTDVTEHCGAFLENPDTTLHVAMSREKKYAVGRSLIHDVVLSRVFLNK